MADLTLCNYCHNEIKYIETRKEGSLKCDPSPVKGIQASGRIVEVYLIHECKDRACDEVLNSKNEGRKLWVGPDTY